MQAFTKHLCGAAALLAVGTGSVSATTYSGNGATGFGGPLGQSTLTVTNDNSGNVTFQVSTSDTHPLGDTAVFYFSTGLAGGINDTTSLTDTGDAGRRAISGNSDTTGRTPVFFATGFNATFAVAITGANNGSANLFSLTPPTGQPGILTFVSGANFALTTTGTGAGPIDNYTFSLNTATLGLPTTVGTSFSFVATYLNPTDNSNGGTGATANIGDFRSNETIGANVANLNNPGNNGALNYTGSDTYTLTAAPVPEPSSIAGVILASALGMGFFVRRNRATSTAS